MGLVQDGKLEGLLERTTSLWIGTGTSEELDVRPEDEYLKFGDFVPLIHLTCHLKHCAASHVLVQNSDFGCLQGESLAWSVGGFAATRKKR